MPDTFCILSWIHMSITPGGFVRFETTPKKWKHRIAKLYKRAEGVSQRELNVSAVFTGHEVANGYPISEKITENYFCKNSSYFFRSLSIDHLQTSFK